MTHLDDAHATLMRAAASSAPESYAFLPRDQARALLDEAARLVAERDRLRAALAGLVWVTNILGTEICDLCGEPRSSPTCNQDRREQDCTCTLLRSG